MKCKFSILSILSFMILFLLITVPVSYGTKIQSLPLFNPYFTGRGIELLEIKKLLSSGERNAVCIRGISGIGKTQLSKMYAYQSKNIYDVIWWFNCKSNIADQIKLLEESLIKRKIFKIRKNFSPENDIVIRLKNIAESSKINGIKVLLIFDDIQDITLLKNIFNLSSPNCHILTSSSSPELREKQIILRGLQISDSIELLHKITKREIDSKGATLAEALDNYPLLLVVAGSFIREHSTIDFESYLELYRKKDPALRSEEHKILESYRDTVMDHYQHNAQQAIEMNFKALDGISDFGKELAVVCSMFSREPIPAALLEIYYKSSHGAIDFNYHKAIKSLLDCALLEEYGLVDEKSEPTQTKSFSMLDLCKIIIHDTLSDKLLKENCFKRLIVALKEFYEQPILELVSILYKNPNIINHSNHIFEKAKEAGHITNDLIVSQIRILYFTVYHQRNYLTAEQKIKEIEDSIKSFKIPDIEMARLLNLKGHVYFLNGEYPKAIEVTRKADEILKAIDRHPEKYDERCLVLANNLAYYLISQGNLSEAISCIDSVSEDAEKACDMYKSAYLSFQSQLLMERGEFESALRSLEEVMPVLKRINDNEDTFLFVDLLRAEMALKSGDTELALRSAKIAYDKAYRICGTEEHELVGRALILLASAQNSVEDLVADESLDKALLAFKSTFGDNLNNRRMAFAYTVSGDIKFRSGDYQNSLEEYLKATSIYDSIFTHFEVDDLSHLYHQVSKVSLELNNFELANEYLRRHIKNFGINHSRTKMILDAFEKKGAPTFL